MRNAITDGQQMISDFLRHLHLGAEVYYVGQLCDAWHMSTPGGSDAATFHLVCHGEAWIHMADGSPPTHMVAGDIAFFANDAAHTFSAHDVVPQQPFDYSRPAPLDKTAPGAGLLCGHLSLAPHVRRLLLASFPDFMLIRPDHSPAGAQIRQLIELMTEEAMRNDLGASAILDRLADTLFLYLLRHALHHDAKVSPLLAALSDDHLRLAVAAFIDAPAEPWTVERMAALAFQSRSTFSERFSQLVRMPPMEFVTTWRMQMASSMLANENANMLDIALRCGYESEASFRKAFKRIVGVPPGKVRGN
jgi:AraC-like DNA-binding protein